MPPSASPPSPGHGDEPLELPSPDVEAARPDATNEAVVDDRIEASDEQVVIALELNLAGSRVRFDVTVPRGPATWEHLLPLMRSLVQVGSEISHEHFAARNQHVSCRAGCAMCCRHAVPIAPFEAHRLRRLVDELPEPQRTEVRRRFAAYESAVKAADSVAATDRVDESPAGTDLETLLRRCDAHFRLKLACPFLEQDSCSIYAERPLKCREYQVLSPASFCVDPQTHPIVQLPLPISVYQTTLALESQPTRDGLPWLPLHELLSWTDTHSPDPPQQTGPELLHTFMKRLMQPRVATTPAAENPSG